MPNQQNIGLCERKNFYENTDPVNSLPYHRQNKGRDRGRGSCRGPCDSRGLPITIHKQFTHCPSKPPWFHPSRYSSQYRKPRLFFIWMKILSTESNPFSYSLSRNIKVSFLLNELIKEGITRKCFFCDCIFFLGCFLIKSDHYTLINPTWNLLRGLEIRQ